MDPALRDHLEALKRFNAWEARELRDRPRSFHDALEWLSEATELADRYGSAEDPTRRRERHLQQIFQVRRALERANLSR